MRDQLNGGWTVDPERNKMASSVAGVIEPTLQAAETIRSAGRPPSDLTAYDLYLRACAMVSSSYLRAAEALRLLEGALARDPRYAPALAYAAICCFRLVIVTNKQSGNSSVSRIATARQAVDRRAAVFPI